MAMPNTKSYQVPFKKYTTLILISLAGSLLTAYFTCHNCQSHYVRYAWVASFSVLLWLLLWIGNDELNTFINRKISWVKYPLRRLVVGIISTIIFTVSAVLSLIKAWEYFLNAQFDNYYEIVLPSLIITFFISLFMHSREFLNRWKESAVDAERLKKESVQAQYESLKNQVNPHFLFNSLNALTNLVYKDQDKAAKFIKQLSEVYRYVMDSRDKELVSLQEELEFLESYIFLQQIRFGESLNMIIDLQSTQEQVAPLALQLLIENAIKHNIIAQGQSLTIRVYKNENYIVVENNLQKKTILVEDSSGLGLENIKRRYEFLSSSKIKVLETDTIFKVEIPIINKIKMVDFAKV